MVPDPLLAIGARAAAIDGRTHVDEARPSPLVLWHLLSLDAPTVATLWMWSAARCVGLALPASLLLTMFLVVWLLYAGDRLLDTRSGTAAPGSCHRFHADHRTQFLWAATAAAVVALALIVRLPMPLLRFYLPTGLALLLWFAFVHLARQPHPGSLPKAFAPACFFPLAVFAPAWQGTSGQQLCWLVLAALVFGAACCLNSLSIFAWEHSADQIAGAHASTRLGVGALTPLGALAVGISSLLALTAPSGWKPVFLACCLTSAALLTVQELRGTFSRLTLRVLADLTLLTPLLLLRWPPSSWLG